MLIGVRSLQNGRKSFHRKKNFKYLQVSSGVSFVVTQLWNLNYVHRLFCFVLEFFFNLLFKSGVWFGLHNIFSVLSDPVGTAAQCFSCPVCVLNPVFTTQGTNLWSELCSQKADWQFSASCFTSCNLFLWFFSFLPSFILLFLSQFFITVTLFFPSFFTFLYLFLLSVFLPCVLLSSFPPSFLPSLLPAFHLYSLHFLHWLLPSLFFPFRPFFSSSIL